MLACLFPPQYSTLTATLRWSKRLMPSEAPIHSVGVPKKTSADTEELLLFSQRDEPPPP